MHVRAMSSPDKELVSAFWVIIFHIIIITIVIIIIIIAAPLGCHRCWGGLPEARPSVCSSRRGGEESRKGKWEGKWGERWTGRGRESWGEEEEGEGGEGE